MKCHIKAFNCLKFEKNYPGDQQIHINELHYTNKRPLAPSQREQTKWAILTWLQIIQKEERDRVRVTCLHSKKKIKYWSVQTEVIRAIVKETGHMFLVQQKRILNVEQISYLLAFKKKIQWNIWMVPGIYTYTA